MARKPGAAAIGSALWKQRVSEGTRRALKPWNDGLKVLPTHVRAFLGRGQVAPSLRPMVSDAVDLIGRYADELGGEDQLTAGQRVLLSKLFRCQVALNAAFSRLLRDESSLAFEQASYLLTEERQVVAALGLDRITRKAGDLETYLAGRRSPNGAPPTLDVTPDREDGGHA